VRGGGLPNTYGTYKTKNQAIHKEKKAKKSTRLEKQILVFVLMICNQLCAAQPI